MNFIYYSADEATIYFFKKRINDHGALLGTISQLPERPAFVVQSLLTNAGYGGITGLTFVHGERQPTTEEGTPE